MAGERGAMGKKVVVHIHKLLDERNMSMRQLSLLTGVRAAALHELANQKRLNIHFRHIAQIYDVLKLNSMDELLTCVDTDDSEDDDE